MRLKRALLIGRVKKINEGLLEMEPHEAMNVEIQLYWVSTAFDEREGRQGRIIDAHSVEPVGERGCRIVKAYGMHARDVRGQMGEQRTLHGDCTGGVIRPVISGAASVGEDLEGRTSC